MLLAPDPAQALGAAAHGDEVRHLIGSFATWCIIWLLSFYTLVACRPLWTARIAASSKEHENCRFWEARNILGILHALLVSALAVPGLISLAAAPEAIQWAASPHVDTCAHPEYNATGQAVALSGLIFTAFIATDLVISAVHRMASWDYVFHHVAFLAAGLVIRGNCILPLNAAVLLAMEASTPFLNFMLFFRNRGPAYTAAVQATGVLFVLLFVVFRLALNGYAAVLLLSRGSTAMPAALPQWQGVFLQLAVVAGSGLQFFWFPAIAKTFCSGIFALLRGSAVEAPVRVPDKETLVDRDLAAPATGSAGHQEKDAFVRTPSSDASSTADPGSDAGDPSVGDDLAGLADATAGAALPHDADALAEEDWPCSR